MSLIGSIVLDDIHEPCDLATALRLLLVDHLDRDEYGIENPDSPYTQDDKLNYRFYGDETSFVLGFETGRGALRVDVRQVDYDEPAEPADSQDQHPDPDHDHDPAERNYLESLIKRLSLLTVIAAVTKRHAVDLTGKPGITAKQWDILDKCINAIGFDEALDCLALVGQTGDETKLIAAYRALKIPLGVALRRLEDESGEEPAEPTVKATDRCCEGECRFGWRKLFGVGRSSPSPTTRTLDQVELGPSEGDSAASVVAGPAALPEIRDPVLARLIDAFHLVETESDRVQEEASAVEDRYQDAGRTLAEHFAATHAERNPDGSLIGYREFVYQGRSYRLEEPAPDPAHKPGARRPYVVYRHPDILTV
jgi:hypothetical protein